MTSSACISIILFIGFTSISEAVYSELQLRLTFRKFRKHPQAIFALEVVLAPEESISAVNTI